MRHQAIWSQQSSKLKRLPQSTQSASQFSICLVEWNCALYSLYGQPHRERESRQSVGLRALSGKDCTGIAEENLASQSSGLNFVLVALHFFLPFAGCAAHPPARRLP